MSSIVGSKMGLSKTLRSTRIGFRALKSCLTLLAILGATASNASAEDRSLKLYFGHTGERAIITYKRDGVFDQAGLKQLNQFLRDWRRNESIKMDPRLFDVVWEVYRRSGATDYINVVSGYRSPNTNALLRTRSSGVAKESQHTRGKAMDFFIPGVKLATLRGLAMQIQGGGVGYYPTSGSPFVHVDVGGVRAWPRMSRQELVQLFPNGKTLHIPSDGNPLPGYETAVAEYKRRGATSSFQLASAADGKAKRKGSFLAALFGTDEVEEEDDAADSAVPATTKRPQQTVKVTEPVAVASLAKPQIVSAPVPTTRPTSGMLTALRPSASEPAHDALAAMTAAAPVKSSDEMPAFADLSAYTIPVPTFASRPVMASPEDAVVTASTNPASHSRPTVKSAEPKHQPLPPALLVASSPSPIERKTTRSFSADYTTGYPSDQGFKPVASTATFDFGRFGDSSGN